MALEVRQFQQGRSDQARYGFLSQHQRGMSKADFSAMKVFQFHKNRAEQAQGGFLFAYSNDISTAHNLAMKVYQFQRDRDEQAGFKFKSLSVMHTPCGRRRLLTAI